MEQVENSSSELWNLNALVSVQMFELLNDPLSHGRTTFTALERFSLQIPFPM
jgi:hypothetical protein